MAQANVLAIHALEELRAALSRFADEAQQALASAAQEARRIQDWLAERQAHWQREVRRREEILRQAEAALRRCQDTVYYDPETGRSYRPDCSGYEMQALRARTYLAEAQAELESVIRWARLVQQTAADYERQAQRLASQLAHDLPKATALLSRSLAALQLYAAMRPFSAESTATASAAPAPLSGASETVPSGQWVEQGLQDVPLEQIDLSDSYVHGPEDYHKVAYQEMREGVLKLEEVVRPAAQAGADGDHFTQMDAEQGLDYPHGYRRVYDAFYGSSEPIRLERVGDVYKVTGGYHRLLVAKELGLRTIPASVIALVAPE